MKLVAFVVAGIFSLGLLADPAKADIEIAVVGPMTGQYAVFGEQMRRGAEQAVSDINASGGLLKHDLELFVGDDGCDPIRAVAIANRLPGDSVKFVAGHLCSAASLQASRIYAEEGLVQITPASTDPALTEQGAGNVFRVSGREDRQGALAGRFIAEHFATAKIAILHNDSAHGKRLAEIVLNTLHAAGITEIMYKAYEPAGSDYSALIARMKAAGISVFYVGGHHTEAAVIIRQAHETGYKPQLIAGDTLTAEEFWQISEGAGEGAIMTAVPDPRSNPAAAAVVSRFRAQSFEPAGYTLATYAAVQVWVEAARTAGTYQLDKVVEVMHNNQFQTVLGDIAFDEKGDISTTSYIWHRWSKGSFKPL